MVPAQRNYSYVGSKAVLSALPALSQRQQIQDPADVLRWIRETKQVLQRDKTVVATFIVDLSGNLWIADQRSEHVACAARQKVLTAGEITFRVLQHQIEVLEVTNQSAGYCPEPESWPAIDAALTRLNIAHPSDFTTAYLFRSCASCGTINIVKDEWFECSVCEAPLSQSWNFQEH